MSVDQINVRGTQIPFDHWFVDSNSTRVTPANFQSQLQYTGTALKGNTDGQNAGMMQSYLGTGTAPSSCTTSNSQFYINEFGTTANPTMCFTQSSGPISLKPGDMAVVYFQIPTGVMTPVDAGSNSNVAIYSGSVGAPQSVTIQAES